MYWKTGEESGECAGISGTVGDSLHALFSLFFSQFLEASAEERVHTRLRISLQVVFFQSHDNYNNGDYRLQYLGSIANVNSTNMDQALHM